MLVNALTFLLLILNPSAAFFVYPQNAEEPQTSSNQRIIADISDLKLPLSENLFVSAQILLPDGPIRNWEIADPKISAKSVLIFDEKNHSALFEYNGIRESRPIASLTKLMTALVVMENAKTEEIFSVSQEAVNTEGIMGGFLAGESLTVKNLLSAMLIESSNDAAAALAENIEKKSGRNFIDLMNKKAANMGLKDTSFADSSGLNPSNFSSAWELVKIMAEVLKQPILVEIMQTKQTSITSQEGDKHILNNTNKLLGKIPQIIAAKTGYTEEAGNCMATAFAAPDGKSTVIVVVMDTPDRMAETSNLIKWTNKAYSW